MRIAWLAIYATACADVVVPKVIDTGAPAGSATADGEGTSTGESHSPTGTGT